MLADFIKAEGAPNHTILISNLLNTLKLDEVKDLYPAQIEVAPQVELAERVRWMQRRLAEIKPRKTYMLLHHFEFGQRRGGSTRSRW